MLFEKDSKGRNWGFLKGGASWGSTVSSKTWA